MKQQFFPQRLFMDMKRLIINRLVGLGLLVVGALVSCNAPTAFVPVPSPNPWVDDYTALSSMENYKQWGTYNVHDPACKKIGDTYYMYSTDAIFAENRKEAEEKNVPLGFIQVRKSKDLVHWDFVGWAFPEIPAPAIEWVHSQAEGKGATNIWAPFLMPYQGIYRLYYCVSAFGRNTSYIGMAESDSPEGPWIQKGCVVKTGEGDAMNAIDPSVIEDPETGKWWMALWLLFRRSVLCGTESRNRNDYAAGGSWALDSTSGQLPERQSGSAGNHVSAGTWQILSVYILRSADDYL